MIQVQENKKSYFYTRIECYQESTNLNELIASLEIIAEEMSADEFHYQFVREEENSLVITSYFKPEKRKRMGQFLKICEKNLPSYMINKKEINCLTQETFENHIDKLKNDPNWKTILEPTGVSKSYIGDDLNHFNDLNNFFPWQKKIYSMILDSEGNVKAADDRKIISIIDTEGKKGKSSFIKFLCFKNPIEIYKLSYGLSSQLRSAVINGGGRKCYIIDLPRTKGANDKMEDLLSVIEEIKNGFITSPMYGKSSILMMEPPFVIVFSNYPLPYQALSKDRWQCFVLTNNNKPDLKEFNPKVAKYKEQIKKA